MSTDLNFSPGDGDLPYGDAQPQPQTPRAQIGKTPKKIPKGLIIGIVTVILLGAGGVFAYTKIFRSPEVILEKMLEKMINVKTLASEGQLTLDMTGQLPPESAIFLGDTAESERRVSVILDFDSLTDFSDLDVPKASNGFALKISVPPVLTELQTISADMIVLGRTLYLRVGDIPFFALGDLENEWIEFNQDDFQGLAGGEVSSDELSPPESRSEFTEEQIEQVKDRLPSSGILRVVEDLGQEKIGGVKTYHYKVEMDREKLIEFMAFVTEDVLGQEIADTDVSEFEEALDESPFKDVVGELWIGKRDNLLYKVRLTGGLMVEQSEVAGEIDVEFNLSQHNQPVSIEAPVNPKGFEEIFGTLLQGFATPGLTSSLSAPSPGWQTPEGTLDSDGDGIGDTLEVSIGTDPNNPDTDGDGYMDGQEYYGGYDPLVPGA